jgi:hypothetical protein
MLVALETHVGLCLLFLIFSRVKLASSPTVWPDAERVAAAIKAAENPTLVIPHPSSFDHKQCEVCNKSVATQQRVPDPATWEEWPAQKGK